jgi:beta-fructofuranosidase
MNDPNGPLIHDGLIHLYFQYRFTTDTESPVAWGHVTSTDFVTWTYHRPAITPHPLLGDRDGCYSGNTVVGPDGRIHAFYSGHIKEEPYQLAYVATSTDDGYTFGAPSLAVAAPTEIDRILTYRDPFVWQQGGRWLMVVGAGEADGIGSALLYSSHDLSQWERIGTFAQLARGGTEWDTGDMWECPQVLDIDGQSLVVFGAWARTGGDMRVFSAVGGSVDSRAAPLSVHPVDSGPDFYAPSVLRDSPFGPIIWGWVREARDPDWWDADGWSGALTLPRTVRLDTDGRMLSSPVPTIDTLRDGEPFTPTSRSASDLGAQFELIAKADAGRATTVRIGLGESESLEIHLDPSNDAVTIDRSRASLDPRAAAGTIEVNDAFGISAPSVRAFIDGSILELFTSGGRVATVRIYPTTAPPWTVEATGDEGAVSLWRLRTPHTGTEPSPVAVLEQAGVVRD